METNDRGQEIIRQMEEAAERIVRFCEGDEQPFLWVPILRRAARALEEKHTPRRRRQRETATDKSREGREYRCWPPGHEPEGWRG